MDGLPNRSARQASLKRATNETRIEVSLDLDGTGVYRISTGVGFLDHMLERLSRHSLIDLTVKAEGDLHIDFHHTTEESGIALGTASAEALGVRKGNSRYGEAKAALDVAACRVALDLPPEPYPICKL